MGRGAGHHLLAQAGVGPAVAVKFRLHRDQRAVAQCARLDADNRAVTFGVENQALLPAVQNLHRTARHLRGQRRVDLSGNILLAAEAAPHQRADHAHLFVIQAQALRNLPPVAVRDLAAHIDRHLVAVVFGRAPLLAGRRAHPAVTRRHRQRALRLQKGVLGHRRAVRALDDDVGRGEPRLHVAVPHLDMLEQVPIGTVRVQLRRVRLQRIPRIGDRRQHLVIDADQRQRLLRDLRRLCHRQRDRVPDIACRIASARENRPVVFDQPVPRIARHVRVGQHRVHALQRTRRVGVDAANPRVGVFAAQRRPEKHPVERIVIGVERRPRHLVDRIRPLQWLTDLRQRLHYRRQHRIRHPAGAQILAGRLHRADDRRVAGAAAIGVLQALLDLHLARVRVLVQQRLGLHDEPGRAEAALRRPVADEGILKRMQFKRVAGFILAAFPHLRQPFDRQHLRALRLERRVNAGVDRLAVDDDGAAAAFGLVTADLRACQPQVVAQYLGQVTAGRYVKRALLAVDGQSKMCHVCAPVGMNDSGFRRDAFGVAVRLPLQTVLTGGSDTAVDRSEILASRSRAPVIPRARAGGVTGRNSRWWRRERPSGLANGWR